MTTFAIENFIYAINPFLIYGFIILLTLVVVSNKMRLIMLPRLVVTISWFVVIGFALSWLLFHVFALLGTHSQITGLAVIARILQYIPVYICAAVVLFMYPKKVRSP